MHEKTVVDTTADSRLPANPQPESGDELLQAEALVQPSFDAGFYASEYRDITGEPAFLLSHFCRCGWKEGRNPNAAFDTVAYLTMNPDVDYNGINPFLHFLRWGQREARTTVPAVSPRRVAETAFGFDPGDWVTLMRPFVDAAFYTASLTPPFDGSFDPVAHFAYRGWLAGYNPHAEFDVDAALTETPRLRAARLNPLLFTIVTSKSRWQESPAEHSPSTDVIQEVAKHFDVAYYSAMYPEAVSGQGDPVSHYCTVGWKDGKNTVSWFDTNYYLATNEDVAERGINPFWHYVVAGRAEGRSSRQPAGYRRQIIDRAASPDELTSTYVVTSEKVLSAKQLERRLRANATTRAGLALSISHDRYTTVTGGIQLFIADEQAQFAQRHMDYLNISPARPLLRLAPHDDGGLMVNLILNGSFLGSAPYATLIQVLKRLPPHPSEQRLLLVHSLFGHAVPEVIALRDALASKADFFWIHDYSSLCVGYTLLRNDVAFCQAPPPDSMICRICVYGDFRPAHLSQLHALFGAIPFQVIAPSEAALQVWQQHTKLPHTSASVHPHCKLVFAEEPSVVDAGRDTIRVAFIGYPRAHKGWPLWQEIVSRAWQPGVYQFIHFGTSEAVQFSLNTAHRIVSTSAEAPDTMIEALAELEIDLVLILSTWPETFSYVTFEALAAGSDIVCLAESGNVAEMVRRHSRGFVANSDAELFAFFESDQALDYVARARARGRRQARLIRSGTTATFVDAVAAL